MPLYRNAVTVWMPIAMGIESEYEWDDEAVVVRLAMERAVDDVGHHDEVHQEVEIEHDRVPTPGST